MKFNIIVAMDKNRGIGLNNQLPWSFKEDITYFKNLTKGAGNNAIIMGKNTYHSINKELPYRDNIILSSTLTKIPENMFLCKSIEELFFLLLCQSDAKIDNSVLDIESKDTNYDDIWIIGGSSIYKQFLDMPEYIDKIFITYIDNDYNCDVFFPELPDYYKLVNSSKSYEKNTLLTTTMYQNNFLN